jgi:phosphatidylglycerol:prolipoprotein diacylglycerol transferase
MYPIIFSYKFITIGGYGIMLGLGFYLAFLLLERELKLAGKDPELAYKILLTAIPSGIAGAKLFHILEHFKDFERDPFGMIFSGAGLSALGGFTVALLASIILIKYNKENFLRIFDLVAAPMSLGYAIGRIGCHVSGDGCYGIETSSIFGTSYPNGIVPMTPYVFPTPLFESLFAFILVALFLQLRKRNNPDGWIFFIYLILTGLARFFVEFIRLNPVIALGMTQSQLISIVFVFTGAAGLIFLFIYNKKTA